MPQTSIAIKQGVLWLIFFILVTCYNSPLVLRKWKGKATATNKVAAMLLWTIIIISNMLMSGCRF